MCGAFLFFKFYVWINATQQHMKTDISWTHVKHGSLISHILTAGPPLYIYCNLSSTIACVYHSVYRIVLQVFVLEGVWRLLPTVELHYGSTCGALVFQIKTCQDIISAGMEVHSKFIPSLWLPMVAVGLTHTHTPHNPAKIQKGLWPCKPTRELQVRF